MTIWTQHLWAADGLRYPKGFELFGWLDTNGFTLDFLNDAMRISAMVDAGGTPTEEELSELRRFSKLYSSPSYWHFCTDTTEKELRDRLDSMPRKESEALEARLKELSDVAVTDADGMRWATLMIGLGVPWVSIAEMTAQQSIIMMRLQDAKMKEMEAGQDGGRQQY